MKIFYLFILNLALLSGSLFSQWSNYYAISTSGADHTGLTNTSAKTIAASGNDVYITWQDSRWYGTGDIYFRRSTNGGLNWLGEQKLTDNQPESLHPSVAVNGSTIYVVWEEYRDGNGEIYLKVSSDKGASWGSDIRLTTAAEKSDYPALSISANGMHLVWRDYRDGNYEIYYKRSTNNGVTWGADIRLTNNPSVTGSPTIVTNGMGVHVAWHDNRHNGYDEIYYKSSTNNGNTWTTDTRITNSPDVTLHPVLATSGLNLYLVYSDRINSYDAIFMKISTDLGGTWGTQKQITDPSNWNYRLPSIAVGNNGNNIYITYQWESGTPDSDIFYRASTNGGADFPIISRMTNLSYGSTAQLVLSGNAVHFVERWRAGSNYNVYYFRNPTGNIPTAISETGTETPTEYTLGQNYPNPFNPVTNITFDIAGPSAVNLKVYDVKGNEVAELVNQKMNAGSYKIDFNAGNLSSGVYFYVLSAGAFQQTKKMMLVK